VAREVNSEAEKEIFAVVNLPPRLSNQPWTTFISSLSSTGRRRENIWTEWSNASSATQIWSLCEVLRFWTRIPEWTGKTKKFA
jgi:hypothetical protein